ncbi:MAG: hypothetical protein JXA54_15045 [Candidatus Heimdallarchaeota archaeon]|nr:hypothetical protein [Candidatus Heimdallarchaeota archaeon]
MESKEQLESSKSQVNSQEKVNNDFEDFLHEDSLSKESEVIPYDSMKVKLKWSRIILVGIILSIFTTGLTLLTMWIIISRNDNRSIYLFTEIILLIECGLFFTFGGCVGTFKQSFTINRIRFRKNNDKKITGADTIMAIGSSYTYVFAGLILGLFSLIAHLIIIRIPSEVFI